MPCSATETECSDIKPAFISVKESKSKMTCLQIIIP